MMYFGDPAFRPHTMTVTEVPEGENCLACSHRIKSDECGFLIPYVDAEGKTSIEPWHRGCFLNSILP